MYFRLNNVICYIIVFCILIITSCNLSNNNTFFREDTLIKFLKKEQKLDLTKEQIIVLVNASDCGACNKRDFFEISKTHLYISGFKTTYIFSKKNSDLEKFIPRTIPFNLKYDNNQVMEKYGLRLSSTYLFHIKNGHIKNWVKARELSKNH